MKTLYHFLTGAALIIQAMVSAQTSVSRGEYGTGLVPVIKRAERTKVNVPGSDYKKVSLEPQKANTNVHPTKPEAVSPGMDLVNQNPSVKPENLIIQEAGKQIAEINEKISALNKQLEELKLLKSGINSQIEKFFDTGDTNALRTASRIIPVNASSNAYFTPEEKRIDLLRKAEAMFSMYHEALAQSLKLTGNQKAEMLSQAGKLKEQAIFHQLEASKLAGLLAKQNFEENNDLIMVYLDSYVGKESVIREAKLLLSEAEFAMKLAREMREEAYSMADLSARLGNLGNAEEKEHQALEKQRKVLGKFAEYSCSRN